MKSTICKKQPLSYKSTIKLRSIKVPDTIWKKTNYYTYFNVKPHKVILTTLQILNTKYFIYKNIY